MTLSKRIRTVLLVVSAIGLFLAGLFLLFAPTAAQDDQSQTRSIPFHRGKNGWIMGAQSNEPDSLAGG